MSRDALVVGVNSYNELEPLESPAKDAEAVARLLEKYGGFRVRRLPEAKKDGAIRVSQRRAVHLKELNEELAKLFMPEDENYIPNTALFYFSGHGWRNTWAKLQEGFLATSDFNPDLPNHGFSLQRLRRLLQESKVRQQIIWLDCCHSGELLNFQETLTEADPGNLGEGHDRNFIVASRGDEAAYAELGSEHSLLTDALLKGLDPNRLADGCVTNYALVSFINQAMKTAPQCPIFRNSGSRIILTGRYEGEFDHPVFPGVCPYKGLSYFDFNDEDPKYFYGRKVLTDQLVEQLREKNFLAVVGASGSGKSSVVRAGLLHQLKLGEKISGSNQWSIENILRPGKHPLQSLAEVFLEPELSIVDRADQLRKAQHLIDSGSIGLEQLITAHQASRVVLVVDQFEECFTLCSDNVERQKFFECLLGAVERSDNKLCLVLTMRADFFGKCLEQDYAGLAKKIENNLVAVTPLNHKELKEAITEPAKQVGLEVQEELATQIITDVEGSPGSLPLLQYTLTEVWKQREATWLTLAAYNRLGGVRGTLQKRANEVYNSLSPEEQKAAKRIFLELTQLGEGTEDTRKQVLKRDLVTSQQSEELVEKVLQKLADAKLVVTNELQEKAPGSGRVAVVDVAHETLIRHWPRLSKWVDESREALRKKRTIQEAAEEWLDRGKPVELAYLLQGSKLVEAEDFPQHYTDSISLSSLAQEFINVSKGERDRILREEEERQQRELDQVRKLLAEEQKAREAAEAKQKAEEKARKAAQRTIFTIAVSLIFGVVGSIFVLVLQQRTQQTIFQYIIGRLSSRLNTPKELENLLKKANNLKEKADKNKNEDDIKGAIASYQTVRERISSILLYEINNNSDLEYTREDREKLNRLHKESEDHLGEMIYQYRIPRLKEELDKAKETNNFGKFLEDKGQSALEQQYTPGPLRTTYELIMSELGAKADWNRDGKIGSKSEAAQIPCETLKEIQRLWREATENRCDWYNPKATKSEFEALNTSDYIPDCRELEKHTLTNRIFYHYTYFAIERLNACLDIPPQKLKP